MVDRADRRRTQGVHADPHAAASKRAKAPEGQHGQVVAPIPSAIREAIEARSCPWCGRGPYKVLATHTNMAHGIGADELRELAGLGKGASICDPDHAANCRDLLIARPSWEEMSRRGREAGGKKALHAAHEGRKRQIRRDAVETDELVGRRFDEGFLLKDIAAETGLSMDGVRGALKRLGLTGDHRTRRAAVPEEKAVLVTRSANAREGIKRAALERRRELFDDFNALGGTVEAIAELADRHGMKLKNMRARLVKIGALPAGRLALRSTAVGPESGA